MKNVLQTYGKLLSSTVMKKTDCDLAGNKFEKEEKFFSSPILTNPQV